MNWYIKAKYHLTMEYFWNGIERLSFKLPGGLYKAPFKFAESRWTYHSEQVDKIIHTRKLKRPN